MDTSDNLHNERERLHVEQSDMEGDLHRLQLRWADAREVKVKASSALTELKKIEAELEHLAEEQRQINLEEKVLRLIKLLPCFNLHLFIYATLLILNLRSFLFGLV